MIQRIRGFKYSENKGYSAKTAGMVAYLAWASLETLISLHLIIVCLLSLELIVGLCGRLSAGAESRGILPTGGNDC